MNANKEGKTNHEIFKEGAQKFFREVGLKDPFKTGRIICSKCRAEYRDQESVDQAKKWKQENGYVPCPILNCPGEMEIIL